MSHEIMNRKVFLVEVRQAAQLLPTDNFEELVQIALRVFADNLSEYGTEQFAAALAEQWRPSIERAREKIEHDPDEMIEITARQAQIGPAAADQLLTAVYRQLWNALPETLMNSIINQVPARLAHTLRACRPGQKRGSF